MPTYEFRCQSCRVVTDHIYSISGKPEFVECACGGRKTQVFLTAPGMNVDHVDQAGYDIGCGRYFSSRREKSAYLKENNLIEVGDSDWHARGEARLNEEREARKIKPPTKEMLLERAQA